MQADGNDEPTYGPADQPDGDDVCPLWSTQNSDCADGTAVCNECTRAARQARKLKHERKPEPIAALQTSQAFHHFNLF